MLYVKTYTIQYKTIALSFQAFNTMSNNYKQAILVQIFIDFGNLSYKNLRNLLCHGLICRKSLVFQFHLVLQVLELDLSTLYITGIFVTTDEDVFEDPNCFSKLRSIANYTYKLLNSNPYMFGNCPQMTERLILHMSTSTKVLTCKSIEVGPVKGTVLKPVDWKFLPKAQQWQRLDCYFEFDDVYPVIVKKSGISVKQQFQVCF